jgi:hypothetical protein
LAAKKLAGGDALRRQKGKAMNKLSVLAAVVLSLAAVSAALATVPKGAVKGTMTLGFLAKYDDSGLAKRMKYRGVWCAWRKKDGHVIVHVSMKNTSVEHVTATILPRYYIAGGGVHGDSPFSAAQDKGFDSGEFRSLWLDAGAPKGTRPMAKISKCAPVLYRVRSG